MTRSSTSYRMGNKKRTKPLPYTMVWNYSPRVQTSQFVSDQGDAPNTWICHQMAVGDYPFTGQESNKALDRFVESFKGGTDASLAVTLAEWRQSHMMIVARSGQILSALRNLKRLRLGDAAKDLGLSRDQVKGVVSRRGAKDTAGQWLELHFGWVPLVQDIYNAVNVLQGPLPGCKARGKAGTSVSFSDNKGQGNWSTFVPQAQGFITIGADVYLENANLALANRMGLINPATVAWELIPFSFLVDWFIPVGNFLNSFSDFVGYRVENPFTTTLRKGTSRQVYLDGRYSSVSLGECVRMTRVLGVPPRRLVMSTFKGLSVTRGATAIALVIQQFLSLKSTSRA
jgi:uncharacterized protein YjiS (DUF1127 family)